MSDTLKIYIEAEDRNDARSKLGALFGFSFYNPNSTDDGEESKPNVEMADIFVTEIPYSDGLLRQVQEELAKERIFNFTRGEQ